MTVDGFALEKVDDGAEIFWWPTLPERFELDGGVVFNARHGWSNGAVRMVPRQKEFPSAP